MGNNEVQTKRQGKGGPFLGLCFTEICKRLTWKIKDEDKQEEERKKERKKERKEKKRKKEKRRKIEVLHCRSIAASCKNDIPFFYQPHIRSRHQPPSAW